jgi:hypothetical protein
MSAPANVDTDTEMTDNGNIQDQVDEDKDQEMASNSNSAEKSTNQEGSSDPAKISDPESDQEAALPKEEDIEELCILDPEAIDVDLNHGKIAKTLCLRWNLIKKIENLSMLTTLKELELYDNQVRCQQLFLLT